MVTHQLYPPSSTSSPTSARLPRITAGARILLFAGLCLVALLLTAGHAPTSTALTLDNAFYIYVGQRILHGVPPYVSAHDQKTPLVFLLDAVALMIGRVAGASDVVASRLFFAPFGALAILATSLSALSLYSVRKWRHGPAIPVVGALVAGACLLATYVVPNRAALGPEPKLITVAAGGLCIWLAANHRWTWAGLCAAASFLTWQPTIVYGVALLVAAILQPQRERRRAVAGTLAGAAVLMAVVGVYFWLAGGLSAALRMTVLAMFDGLGRAAGGEGLLRRALGNAWSIWLVARGALAGQKILFPLGALGIVLFAVVEPLRYMWRRRIAGHVPGDMGGSFRSVAWLSVTTVSLGFAAFSLTDFQGAPDLIPLLIVMAWGVGWLALLVLDELLPAQRPGLAVVAGLVGALALAGWATMDSHVASHPGFTLQTQQQLSQAFYDRVGANTEVQALSCLTPLVMTDRPNATPVWHIGPVFQHIVDREVGGTEKLAGMLKDRGVPVVILVTQYEGNRKLAALLEPTYDRRPLDLPLCGSWYPMEILLRKQ